MADADDERFGRAIDAWSKTTLAAVLLSIPVFLLVALDAPQWIGLAYVLVMGCVLAVIVVRGVRDIYRRTR